MMNSPERKLSNGALIKYSGYHDHVLDEPHYYYGTEFLMNRIPRGTLFTLPEPLRSEIIAASRAIDREVEQYRSGAQAYLDHYER